MTIVVVAALRAPGALAVKAETGVVAWEKFDTDTHEVMPTTLCVHHGLACAMGRLYCDIENHVLCTWSETWVLPLSRFSREERRERVKCVLRATWYPRDARAPRAGDAT